MFHLQTSPCWCSASWRTCSTPTYEEIFLGTKLIDQEILCSSTNIMFINKYYVYRQSIFRKIGKPVRQRKPTMEMVDHTLPANTGLSKTLKPLIDIQFIDAWDILQCLQYTSKQSSSSPPLRWHYLGSPDVTVPRTPTRTDCGLLVAFLIKFREFTPLLFAILNHYKLKTHKSEQMANIT